MHGNPEHSVRYTFHSPRPPITVPGFAPILDDTDIFFGSLQGSKGMAHTQFDDGDGDDCTNEWRHERQSDPHETIKSGEDLSAD